MEFLQRLDDQIVDGEPDRPSPVGVAAEQAGAGFRRLVIHTMLHPIYMDRIGMVAVVLRQRPDAVRGEKFLLVQQDL